MIDLDPPFAWADDLADAMRILSDGGVPILPPGSPERAERWARVLAWYGPPPMSPAPATADARVVSIGTHHDLGQLASATLQRPHRHLPDLDALLRDPGPPGGSVMIVAPAALLTLSALLPILTAYAAQRTAVGLLTGRDNAAITFALAKIRLATTGPIEAPSCLIDGTTGLSHALPDGARIATASALATSWHSLLIDAHGSAAHAQLGTTLLCGLTGQREHDIHGRPIPGGCSPGRCKTDPSGRHPTVAPHDLATQVLGLFVCNAITLTLPEQFPSDVNLVLDAIDGHPAAIFGLLHGDLNTSSAEPALAAHLLHHGHSLGRCVTNLDLHGHQRGIQGPTAVLIGDPEHRPHSAKHALAKPHIRYTGSVQPVTDDDLIRWDSGVRDAAALEAALRTSLGNRPDPDLESCLAHMAEHSGNATQIVLAAHRSPTTRDEFVLTADGWARAALSILTQTRSGAFARQITAVQAHHRRIRSSPAAPCPYCDAPRIRDHLSSPLPLTDRTSLRCPRCGPALNAPDTADPIEIHAPRVLRPGHQADIELRLPETANGVIAVHLRPRTTSSGSYDHTTLTATPGSHFITLAVPSEARPELDRLWVVHADRFRLTLCQLRIPTLPLGAEPRT